MNMEQISMMMQLMAQQSQISGSNAGKNPDGDSFQDLMSQKQDTASTVKNDSGEQQTQTKPAKDGEVQQAEQNPQEEVPEVSDDVRQTLAAMLNQPFVLQDTVAVQQPMQETAANVVVAASDTVVSQTVQTAVVTETAMPVQQEVAQQAPTEFAQQVTTGLEQQTAEVVIPQEGVQQQNLQNGSADTQQQMTADVPTEQAAVQTEQAEQPDDSIVSVTQKEQPLFQDVESVPVKVGEATTTVDVNAPDMDQRLSDTIQAKLQTVGDKVQIQLKPENLGQITIELTQDGSKLGLVIYADNAKTTSLLAQHAGNLAALLEDRTGQTVQIQVQQQEAEQPQYDGHNQQNRQQQEQQSRPQQSKAEQDSFLGQLRLGLFQLDTV